MTGRDFGAVGAAPARAKRRAGADRHSTCCARRASRRCAASASASSPTTPAAPATARRRSICSSTAPDVKLVALFSPEHGIRGILDANVPSEVDEKTKLPIHSLYGDTRRPTDAMLDGLDAIVIDLQDIGARFYTYMTTMAYVMEEAAKRKLPVFVLDRPNPVNGWQIEGPALDKDVGRLHRLFPGDADPPRHDARRAGEAVQRREQDRRRSHRRRDEELAARRLVRRDRRCRGSTRRRTCAT